MLQSNFPEASDDVVRRKSGTLPVCPGCCKLMVFERKNKVLFTDGLAEAVYRCETCEVETKLTVKFP